MWGSGAPACVIGALLVLGLFVALLEVGALAGNELGAGLKRGLSAVVERPLDVGAAVVGDRRVGARLLAHWCRLLVRCVPVSLGISFLTLLILSKQHTCPQNRVRLLTTPLPGASRSGPDVFELPAGEANAAFAPDVSGTSISVTRSRCAVVSTRAGSLLWSYP